MQYQLFPEDLLAQLMTSASRTTDSKESHRIVQAVTDILEDTGSSWKAVFKGGYANEDDGKEDKVPEYKLLEARRWWIELTPEARHQILYVILAEPNPFFDSLKAQYSESGYLTPKQLFHVRCALKWKQPTG